MGVWRAILTPLNPNWNMKPGLRVRRHIPGARNPRLSLEEFVHKLVISVVSAIDGMKLRFWCLDLRTLLLSRTSRFQERETLDGTGKIKHFAKAFV
jgi:hypothetical protein